MSRCLPVLKRRTKPNEAAKKTRRNGEQKSRTQNVKTETAKKTWKRRYFRQPATMIAVSDFERWFCIGGLSRYAKSTQFGQFSESVRPVLSSIWIKFIYNNYYIIKFNNYIRSIWIYLDQFGSGSSRIWNTDHFQLWDCHQIAVGVCQSAGTGVLEQNRENAPGILWNNGISRGNSTEM